MRNDFSNTANTLGYNLIELDSNNDQILEKQESIIALVPTLYLNKDLLRNDVTQKAGILKIGRSTYPAYAGGVLDTIQEVIQGSISISECEREPSDYSLELVV